jgi:hypothetical protein
MHYLTQLAYETMVCLEGYDCSSLYAADDISTSTSLAREDDDDDSEGSSSYHFEDTKHEKQSVDVEF